MLDKVVSSPHVAPRNIAARVGGWAGLLVFAGAATTTRGYFISFRPPFTRVGEGEAALWLTSALVLLPTAVCFALGYQRVLGAVLDGVRARLSALTPRDRPLGLVALGLLAVALARLCNELVLEGYPVTDDEWAVRFGGELLAQGQVALRLPFDMAAMPPRFLFFKDGLLTSFDWLGPQLAWAFSTLTHSGNWVFALAAAVPVPCLAYVLARRLSVNWALAGAALFVSSPMAFALSMTTHAHLLSRALLALALALSVWARPQRRLIAWLLVGLSLGGAAISRPVEAGALALPLLVAEAWRALRAGGRAERLALAAVCVGALVPLALFFLHAHAVTGQWLPARVAEGAIAQAIEEPSYWVRFGSNSAFNLVRLGVWFAGPVGIALCLAGAMTSRLTRLLGVGVLLVLAAGLIHDNYGIHAVGPIHQSECAVPLAVLAIFGLRRVTHLFRELSLDARLPALITACWLVVGHGLFNAVHTVGLVESAKIQREVYAALDRAVPPEARPAVVFSPSLYKLIFASKRYQERGSWVYEWRRPRPDFSDEVMVLIEGAGEASVRAAFPERHFFTLKTLSTEPYFELTEAR